MMSAWLIPLPKDIYGEHVLTGIDWFPRDGVVKLTEKGSNDSEIIPAFIKHLDGFVRTVLPEQKSYLLCVDCHGFRKGY